MLVARIYIRGWTASFRYPAFVSGFQPTLPVPPLSTIYGLLSAAKGERVTPSDTGVGFVFQSHGRAVDLEAVYELHDRGMGAHRNLIRRELLYEPELMLYVSDIAFADYFRRPSYPLLLGRSTEPAMVVESEPYQMQVRSGAPLGGSIFPFGEVEGITGVLQALPTHFTDEIPRRALGTRPFYLIETDFSGQTKNRCPFRYERELPYDAEHDWGVYMHG